MNAATAEPTPIDKPVRALLDLEPAQAHVRRRFGLPASDEPACRRVAELFRPPPWVSGQISIHDAMFLYDITRAVRPRRAIEIGTASGASAAVLLLGIADAGHASPAGGPVVHTFDLHPFCWFDRSREVGSAAAEMTPALSRGLRIHPRGTAADAGRLLAGLEVELAFIDADHRHPTPVADLLLLLPALARGAWVVLHDIALPDIASHEEARTGMRFEGRYHGAKNLFDGWPWEKIAGGAGPNGRFGASNIGAIRLPHERAVLESDLRLIIDKPWETTPEPRALAVLGERGKRARPQLRAVGLIAPHGVSGVSSATARLTELEPPHHSWRIMALGPGADAPALPGSDSPGFTGVAWEAGTSPVDQVRRVRDALRDARADVVNPNFLLQGFIAAALDRHRGRRIAAIWHGSEWAAEDLYERAAPLADAWRAVSPRIAARVARLLGTTTAPGPEGVLGAAVRVPQRVTPPPCSQRRAEPLRILYAAWLDERSKRVMDLAALADHLATRGVDFRLTIAGRGPAAKKLAAALAGHIVAGRVTMPGPIPLEKMTQLHREHDVLVLASANEGSPVIVMEAMAQGRPVAITRGCGGALEAVRDGVEGVVVGIGDMDAMAAGLAAAWKDPERLARMGAAAHAAATSRFSLPALADRYDALVEEAARAPGGPDPANAPAVGDLWSHVLGALEMLGPSRPSDLAGLCAEWLSDLGSREVWLHWTPDAPDLIDSLARVAPTLLRGVIASDGSERRLGWPVIHPTSAHRNMLVLTSDPGTAPGAATLLALVEPRRGGLASRRLAAAAQHLRQAGCRRIALYGAGKHTRRLARWIAQIPEITAIIDDRAGERDGPGARLWGLPVARPDQLDTLRVDGVIVSSDEYERTMLIRARQWGGRLKIVGMYEGLEGF